MTLSVKANEQGISPTSQEFGRVNRWIRENLLCPERLPYSFMYGDNKIAAACETWLFSSRSRNLDEYRTEFTTVLSDPATSLEVTCIIVQNHKYPVVEWTLWFENKGYCSTPILNQIYAIDADFLTSAVAPVDSLIRLHYFLGDSCLPNSYEPKEHIFVDGEPLILRPHGGRPTNGAFPYYRIQGESEGTFFVISWQGQWSACFQPAVNAYKQMNGLHIVSGQQSFHASLMPGEKIRAPMIVLMPYDGADGVRAQNLWRRWFLDFNLPRIEGKRIKPFYANYCGLVFNEMVDATENDLIRYVDLFLDNGIPFDYLWMDAGWYEGKPGTWDTTGTWKPDPVRFPRGIRAISDYVHQKGIKTLLWFEPERVMSGTELFIEHPQWLLGGNPRGNLLDLGNDEARQWIANRINMLIKSEAIDLYRQDFNMNPLVCWQMDEQPDRQGIRENHYCTGYLKFLDEILAANPDLLLDSCASGGRRNDLETMRRALPLHKTDYFYANYAAQRAKCADLAAKQAMHHTLFQWLPFYGSINHPGDQSDIYYHRTALLLPYVGCENVMIPDFDFKKLAVWMQEWREIAHCLYGDYYPLTPYSRDERDWIGWQFHLSESNEGVVQIFMRSQSVYEKGVFYLRGLIPAGVYEIKDFNTNRTKQIMGAEFIETGIVVEMKKRPDSAMYAYHLI